MSTRLAPAAAAEESEVWARARLQRAVGAAFEVRALLGRGAFADVFDAFDPQLKRRVAIKVLRSDLPHSPELQQRFRREAELIAALRHPNLVPIHAIGEHDGLVYLVLEHIRGESLEQALQAGPPALDEVRRLLDQVLDALAAAHEAGVVHRDLKPDNIMLEGAERRVQVMDFGIARALSDGGSMTAAGAFLGTPQYSSPEQIAGDAVDGRSDLYAVGIIGYRLLTGRLPFDGPSAAAILGQHLSRVPPPLRHLRPDCPPELAAAIERALAKSPAERWDHARAMRAALSRSTAEEVNADEPDAAAAGALRAARQRLGRRALAATLVLFAAAMLSLLLVREPALLLAAFAGTLAWVAHGISDAWVQGMPWRDLLGWQERGHGQGEVDVLGRHGAAVRSGHRDRLQIVRRIGTLSHVEQRRFRGCVAAADHLLVRATQLGRRLAALDAQVGAERIHQRQQTPFGAPPRRLLDELVAARTQLRVELEQTLATIGELRHAVLLADAADGERQLSAALDAAERCARS